MTSDVRSAVILAAGCGRRLGERGREIPKGFLRLGDQTLIDQSLARLRSVGIEDVVIVTGHLAHEYEHLAAGHSGRVRTVHNPDFARSGSLVSLWTARELLEEPCLLLESDIVYERRALTTLLDCGAEDAVLLSGPTGAGDEVWVSGTGGCLAGMSKRRDELEHEILGELVGICRLSPTLSEQLVRHAEEGMKSTLDLDYEVDGLVAAARVRPISCPIVEDLAWCEIDDVEHLRRAEHDVFPRILAHEASRSGR